MKLNNLYLKLSERDYSNNDKDKYAQLLQTIHYHMSSNGEIDLFYNLLEKADKENKEIIIKPTSINLEEFSFSDLLII